VINRLNGAAGEGEFTAPPSAFSALTPQTIEPQTIEPQTIEPLTTEPQTTEPQTTEPQTIEPQTIEPQGSSSQTESGLSAAAMRLSSELETNLVKAPSENRDWTIRTDTYTPRSMATVPVAATVAGDATVPVAATVAGDDDSPVLVAVASLDTAAATEAVDAVIALFADYGVAPPMAAGLG
jgi:hypothetical protein